MYDPEAKDRKVIKLVEELLEGSELEKRTAFQYNTIEVRVLNKINKLSKKMFKDGLVVSGLDGKYRKSDAFAEYWENRSSFWDAAPSTTKDDACCRTTIPSPHDDVSKALAPLTTGNSPVVKPTRKSATSTIETPPNTKVSTTKPLSV